MTNAIIVSGSDERSTFYRAINLDRKTKESTKKKYLRAVDRALEAGVNFRDALSVQSYAATLPTSSRGFLKAAVNKWRKQIKLQLNNSATGTVENEAQLAGVERRLDAIYNGIDLDDGGKGKRSHYWLSALEVERLKACVNTKGQRGRRDLVLLSLLVNLGLRRSEAVRATWADIKTVPMDNGRGHQEELEVVGKGDKVRAIPIKHELLDLLQLWRKETGSADDDRIVRGLGPGGVLSDDLTPSQVYNIVRKYGAQLARLEDDRHKARELGKLAPHDLRRTFGRLCHANNVPMTLISMWMGHSSDAVTRGYLGLDVKRDGTIPNFIP